MSAKNRLKNLLLKELSFVDAGANQHARISLFKRAQRVLGLGGEDEDTSFVSILQSSVDSILKAADLSPAARIELLDQSLDQFKHAVLKTVANDDSADDNAVDDSDVGDTPVPVAKDDDDDDTDGDGGDSDQVEKHVPDAGASTGESHTSEGTVMKNREEILKGLSPEGQALIADIEKSAKDANERAEKVEKARAEEKRVEVAKGLVLGTGVVAEDVAKVLGQLDEPGQTVVKGILAKTAEFAKAAKLFDELGSEGAASTGATALEKAASEIRKANPALTGPQAVSKALELNPELYDAAITQ